MLVLFLAAALAGASLVFSRVRRARVTLADLTSQVER